MEVTSSMPGVANGDAGMLRGSPFLGRGVSGFALGSVLTVDMTDGYSLGGGKCFRFEAFHDAIDVRFTIK